MCRRVLRERHDTRIELTRDGALPERTADERDAPPQRLLAAERAAELAAAIAALPPGQRDAIVLFHLADLPQATVAARLGTPAGAVRTRLHKGRATLRTRLAPTNDTMQEDAVSESAIPAQILDVRRTPAGRHVVVLAAAGDELPIWIGAPEAEALVAGLQNVELPRPNAHALALSLLDACGRRVSSVRVCRLQAAIFYAEVVLDDGTTVDARPSDAFVLAVAADLPIEIDRDVLDATRGGAPTTTRTICPAPPRAARPCWQPSFEPNSPATRTSSPDYSRVVDGGLYLGSSTTSADDGPSARRWRIRTARRWSQISSASADRAGHVRNRR